MQLIEEIDTAKWPRRKKIGLLLLCGGLLLSVMDLGEYLGVPKAKEVGTLQSVLSLVVVIAPVIILHEGLHGLFFWLFTGKTKFGAKLWSSLGPVFYASSPGSLIPRARIQIVALAPQALTILLFSTAVLVSMPAVVSHSLLLAAALNLGGGGLDIYFTWSLRKYPRTVLVEDLKTGCKIYEQLET